MVGLNIQQADLEVWNFRTKSLILIFCKILFLAFDFAMDLCKIYFKIFNIYSKYGIFLASAVPRIFWWLVFLLKFSFSSKTPEAFPPNPHNGVSFKFYMLERSRMLEKALPRAIFKIDFTLKDSNLDYQEIDWRVYAVLISRHVVNFLTYNA